MFQGFDLENAGVVVELGPGTGSVTDELLDAVGGNTRFLAIEQSEEFVKHLAERFPDLEVIHGCASETPAHLAARELGPANYVISGLPWAGFPPDLQDRLLSAIVDSLAPGGQFSTFAYKGPSMLPKGRRFRRALHRHFDEVHATRLVWRNLPPAFAYQCRKR